MHSVVFGTQQAAMSQTDSSREKKLPYAVALLCVLLGLGAGLMGHLEVWQRPFMFLAFGDMAWLWIMIGCFAAVVLAWPGRWQERIVCASLCIILAITVWWMPRSANRERVVELLLGHEELLNILEPGSLRINELYSQIAMDEKPLIQDLLDRVGINTSWFPQHTKGIRVPDLYDHLLETCRWPTRLAFVQRIFEDPTRVVLATQEWHRLFPAVVGQDVTLAHRSELIDWLAKHAGSADAPVACRDAAVLWIALIVLTDVEAFEEWIDPAIEMMLAIDDPPMSATGDVWMRALDLLIGLMPAERHAVLTAPLVADSALMRRALRQRMRGMHHHFEVIREEMERSPHAAAMWADMKRIADRVEDEDAAGEIDGWLAVMMAEWLMGDDPEDVLSKVWNFAEFVYPMDIPKGLRGLAEFVSPAMQGHLFVREREVLNFVEHHEREAAKAWMHRSFYQAMAIASLLGDDMRAEIHKRAAMILVDRIPKMIESENPRRTEMVEMVHIAGLIFNGLDAETVGILRDVVLEWCVHHDNASPNGWAMWRTAVVLDAHMEAPSMSPAEWIALWQLGESWFGAMPAIEPESAADFFDIITSNELSEDAIEAFRMVRRRQNFRMLTYNQLAFRGMLHGMVTPEQLPLGFGSSFHDHGPMGLFSRGPYYPAWPPHENEAEIIRSLLQSVEMENYAYHHYFIEFLMDHPLRPESRRVIVEHLLNRLDEEDLGRSTTAFHWLLQFAEWLEPNERAEFRERFHRFFRSQRISIREWEKRFIHYNSIETGRGLLHRGEQVPWDDDALSAEFSWSSSIHHDLAIMPWRTFTESSVFRHLHASGTVFHDRGLFAPEFLIASLDEIESCLAYRDDVPCPREVATPWQVARSLHLRRPDLDFPERAMFRPEGKRVYFRSEVVRVWGD